MIAVNALSMNDDDSPSIIERISRALKEARIDKNTRSYVAVFISGAIDAGLITGHDDKVVRCVGDVCKIVALEELTQLTNFDDNLENYPLSLCSTIVPGATALVFAANSNRISNPTGYDLPIIIFGAKQLLYFQKKIERISSKQYSRGEMLLSAYTYFTGSVVTLGALALFITNFANY